MCRDYVTLHCKGQLVDAMTVTIWLLSDWGVRIDWHVMGDALEQLDVAGIAPRKGTGRDGQATYIVNR